MIICSLQPGGVLFPVLTPVERRQRRKSRDYMARRWTTGIEKGQLPIPIVVDESMDDSSVTLSQVRVHLLISTYIHT